MGRGSQQMYNQFLYRLCDEIESLNICMFSPPLYLTGPSNNKIRKNIFSKVSFNKGFVFESSNFADVKSWPLSFSILSSKK